jgi:hypothetical protein
VCDRPSGLVGFPAGHCLAGHPAPFTTGESRLLAAIRKVYHLPEAAAEGDYHWMASAAVVGVVLAARCIPAHAGQSGVWFISTRIQEESP